MDTLVHIEGFNPAIEPWEETEIDSGRCIVSFNWTDNISDQNTRQITITLTRSASQGIAHLVSCIKASDGVNLITNSDILRISMAISPVAVDQEKYLRGKWRDSMRLRPNPKAIDQSIDQLLYDRVRCYSYPVIGQPRRGVFKCSTWCDEALKHGLFTWLDTVREATIAQSEAHAPGTSQQPSPGISSDTGGRSDTGGQLSEAGEVLAQPRGVMSIHALLNARGPRP